MVEVKIIYCRPCGFQSKAIKLANDILSELGYAGVAVKIIPGNNGIFDVYVDDKLVFSRHKEKRFPEVNEIINAIKTTNAINSA
mgnify:CR=1 FL=1